MPPTGSRRPGLADGELRFRPLSRADFVLLGRWLAAPHVAAWWREDPSGDAVERRYGPAVDGADPTEMFVVEWRDEPVGFTQRYRFADDPAWARVMGAAGAPADSVGIDYYLGRADLVGRGLGPLVIDCFVLDTWSRHPDAGPVMVDVSVGNRRSWRALEKAGFRRVWSGLLDSDDPSDDGVAYVYRRDPPPTRAGAGGPGP